MSYKTALVFGGSGFVGRAVVQKLAAQHYNIRVACRNINKAQFLKSMGEVGQIVPVQCDITSIANIQTVMQGADIVINTIGIIAETKSQTFERVHGEGPKMIAQAAYACAVKQLIHISAIGANITSPSRYAQTKALGEQFIRQHYPQAIIIRPSLIFGPDDHFFNLFAGIARILPILPLIGGGHTRFQPIYVGDVASSIMYIIGNTDYHGQTYEFGGPDILSFRQMLELMTTILKRRNFLIPLPFGLATFIARFLELLPGALLTRDQVIQLKNDNIPAPCTIQITELGITPQSLHSILPTYLKSYMKND